MTFPFSNEAYSLVSEAVQQFLRTSLCRYIDLMKPLVSVSIHNRIQESTCGQLLIMVFLFSLVFFGVWCIFCDHGCEGVVGGGGSERGERAICFLGARIKNKCAWDCLCKLC